MMSNDMAQAQVAGRSTSRARRAAIASAVVGCTVAAGATAGWATAIASFGKKIVPNQRFVGSVNGSSAHASIQMGCFGPSRPGQTGHPFVDQSAEVLRAQAVARFGNTGKRARHIIAYFPSPRGVPQRISFTSYGVRRPIPTSFVLPCFGSGRVTFKPKPTSPTAKTFSVTVQFSPQP